ncbi:hypothetical protein B188_28360 [Candidatus Brocadiaceae bacterium B188]|nr:DUF2726 domain-containing protein [Candidatus Brocadia sapporoensis]QQR65510.1 MAG: DUF2726 domain-containing protein [Candidatus Brocadia sp.]RZV57229.1 MAG: DUF2726 domain-containing protein [Candidatus Brocadia sp. BROELEC01]TWU50404.1 hypothetical protein B188_28360 [Candidatus Brocadiaceae bacterium B188]
MLKKLLNLPESVTDALLREVCQDFDAHVFAKVRVADVLKIECSGIPDDMYKYALQAHFDFVVSNSEHEPLFAVEFDGPTHSEPDSKRRDGMKNEICERFDFSLLRINRRYLDNEFSSWDVLRWFRTVFFVKKDRDRRVQSGEISYEDSIFDPMFVSVRTKSGWRSLELERTARGKLGELFRSGRIPFYVPNWITARDGNHRYRALAWIATDEERGVMVETAMQYHRLGDWVQFAIRGIVLNHLVLRVQSALKGEGQTQPCGILKAKADEFRHKYDTIIELRVG